MKRRMFAYVCVVSLLLTGCMTEIQNPDDSLWQETPENTAEEAEEETGLPNAFSLPYTVGWTLDPITCKDGMQQVVASLLYEGLFRLDRELEPQPLLCSNYVYDPDAFSYTLTLRGGVCFSDGSPLTAGDVKATLERARSAVRYSGRMANVKSITAGNGVVTVSLIQPDTGFCALLDIPIVKAGTESGIPLGTGPYFYEGGAPCLTAAPDWWQGGARPVRQIPLVEAADQDAMRYHFTCRTVQLITSDLTGSAPATVSGSISCWDADTTVLLYLGCNTAKGAMTDPALRQAVGLGLNRPALVSAMFSGHGRAAQFPVSPSASLYPASLEKAPSKSALEAAVAACTPSSSHPLTLLVSAENSFKVSAAAYIADACTDAGLPVEVRTLPWAEYTAALAAGNFDLYFGEVKLTANWDLTPLLATGGALNYGGWADAQTDALLSAFRSAENRADACAALCAHLQQQAPILPICFKTVSVLTHVGVADLTPTAAEPLYGLPAIHLQEP